MHICKYQLKIKVQISFIPIMPSKLHFHTSICPLPCPLKSFFRSMAFNKGFTYNILELQPSSWWTAFQQLEKTFTAAFWYTHNFVQTTVPDHSNNFLILFSQLLSFSSAHFSYGAFKTDDWEHPAIWPISFWDFEGCVEPESMIFLNKKVRCFTYWCEIPVTMTPSS